MTTAVSTTNNTAVVLVLYIQVYIYICVYSSANEQANEKCMVQQYSRRYSTTYRVGRGRQTSKRTSYLCTGFISMWPMLSVARRSRLLYSDTQGKTDDCCEKERRNGNYQQQMSSSRQTKRFTAVDTDLYGSTRTSTSLLK